jgi:hypothetical protein
VIWETKLFLAGFVAEAAMVALILFRRVYRILPFFSCFMIWSLVQDAGSFYLIHQFPNQDVRIYLVGAVFDSIFIFVVLVEISMSVLRPVRSSLSNRAIVAVGLMIALAGAIIWPFAKSPGFDQLLPESQMNLHLQLTSSALRILFFLALALCSQWLSIGWRDRELQIATGFGFYSLASLSAALFHNNQAVGRGVSSLQFHLVDLMVVASYVCSIAYWIVCFAQEVPERRKFTPQMQSFLLAVAGNARTTRMAMTQTPDSKDEDRDGR